MPAKRGRLSESEMQFIRENCVSMTHEQIGEKLNRLPETVAAWAKDNVLPPTVASKEDEFDVVRYELKQSESWKRLKDELTEDELVQYEEEYLKLMVQFKQEGVLRTEEVQIGHAIKYDILMTRNLVARRKARTEIGRLEGMLSKFLKQFNEDPSMMSDQDKGFLLNMETQLQAAKAAEQARTNEYVKLQERHESLMKTLKATRDQRIKQIESSKTNYLGLIKMLMERGKNEEEGRQLELMKVAKTKEQLRLGRPMKYDDGNEDSPILSADTVDLGPEESEGDGDR